MISEKMFLIQQSQDFLQKFDSWETLFVQLSGHGDVPSDMDELKHDITLLETHLADLQRLKFKIENTFEILMIILLKF